MRRGTTGDLDKLSRLFAAAFLEDPLIAWVFPNAQDRYPRTEAFFELQLRSLYLVVGGSLVTNDGHAAVLTAPYPLPSYEANWQMQRELYAIVGRGRFRELLELADAVERARGPAPHVHLAYLAVSAGSRRMGLGTTLVAEVVRQSHELGLDVHLETARAELIPYFQQLGFSSGGVVEVHDSPGLTRLVNAVTKGMSSAPVHLQ